MKKKNLLLLGLLGVGAFLILPRVFAKKEGTVEQTPVVEDVVTPFQLILREQEPEPVTAAPVTANVEPQPLIAMVTEQGNTQYLYEGYNEVRFTNDTVITYQGERYNLGYDNMLYVYYADGRLIVETATHGVELQHQ